MDDVLQKGGRRGQWEEPKKDLDPGGDEPFLTFRISADKSDA